MNNDKPLLPHRGGHLLCAALTGFIGGYNLWVAASGLTSGRIWVFTKRAAEQASRQVEPGWFWATFAGRFGFGIMLAGAAVACVVKAFKEPAA